MNDTTYRWALALLGLISAMSLACGSGGAKDEEGSIQETSPAARAPSSPNVSITPRKPLTGDDLVAVVRSEGDDSRFKKPTYLYMWFRDGVPQEIEGARVESSLTQPGDHWRVEVRVEDESGASVPGVAHVDVVRRAPEVTDLALSPRVPLPGRPVGCEYTYLPGKGEQDRSQVEWYVNGGFVAAEDGELPAGSFGVGDKVACQVLPFDGQQVGEYKRLEQTASKLRFVRDVNDKKALSNTLIYKAGDRLVYKGESSTPSYRIPLKLHDAKSGDVRLDALFTEEGVVETAHVYEKEGRLFFVATHQGKHTLYVREEGEIKSQKLREFHDARTVSIFGLGRRLFLAIQFEARHELWGSDGTYQGTQKLRESELRASQHRFVTAYKDHLIFSTKRDKWVDDLWRSDGTKEGTKRFKSLNVWLTRRPTAIFKGAIYFTTQNKDGENALWRSDGTEQGTQRISLPDVFGKERYIIQMRASERAFFATVKNKSNNHTELWSTMDGLSELRHLDELSDGTPVLFPEIYTVFQHKLVFTVKNDSESLGLITDGTKKGTWAFTKEDASLRGKNVAILRDQLVFDHRTKDAYELWVTRGTPKSTKKIKRFDQPYLGSGYRRMFTVGNTIYFAFNSADVWETDGTEQGTRFLLNPQKRTRAWKPAHTFDSQGLMYMDGMTSDLVLQSDGSNEGTRERVLFHDSDRLKSVTQVGGQTFFVTINKEGTYSLWAADDLEGSSPNRLVEFPPDIILMTPQPGTKHFYFSAILNQRRVAPGDRQPSRSTLWRSDGTKEGTFELKVFNGIGEMVHMAPDEELIFVGKVAGAHEFWRTDGTREGTISLGLDKRKHMMGGLVQGNQGFFFQEQLEPREFTLWFSDKTPTNTRPVQLRSDMSEDDLFLYNSWSIVGLKEKFYLLIQSQGYRSTDPPYLWESDGTQEGTKSISQSAPEDTYRAYSSELFRHNGAVYFIDHYGKEGSALWLLDQTPFSPRLVRVFSSHLNNKPQFKSFNGHLYFLMNIRSSGPALWRTDGTSKGTEQVASIQDGEYSGLHQILGSTEDHLYLRGSDATATDALWVIDAMP